MHHLCIIDIEVEKEVLVNFAWVILPERPEGAKDEVKRPEGPLPRLWGPEGPYTSSLINNCIQFWPETFGHKNISFKLWTALSPFSSLFLTATLNWLGWIQAGPNLFVPDISWL